MPFERAMRVATAMNIYDAKPFIDDVARADTRDKPCFYEALRA